MLGRILAIAMNSYREAVRARVLHGLLAAALATAAYSLVLGALSLHQEARVIADVGSASISLYAVLVAIVLGATSLHRELELKTLFPILTRRLVRHEYLLGKYLGILATLAIFVAIDGASVLMILATQSSQSVGAIAGTTALLGAVLAVLLIRAKHTRVFVLIPWSLAAFMAAYLLAAGAGAERQLVLASCVLTIFEVAIVSAVATFFSSFSSPFLTAIFTLGVFLVGRSADTLAHLPDRVFGKAVHDLGVVLARIFPNLHLYVPPRVLLLGKVPSSPVWPYVGQASLHAVFSAAVLLTLSALIFRKRDFH
jgi:ABC-type transport system involved in multi-copper enzyme maturation permease subunit